MNLNYVAAFLMLNLSIECLGPDNSETNLRIPNNSSRLYVCMYMCLQIERWMWDTRERERERERIHEENLKPTLLLQFAAAERKLDCDVDVDEDQERNRESE